MPYLKKKTLLYFLCIQSSQNKTKHTCWFSSHCSFFADKLHFTAFVWLWKTLKDFEREACQFFRCLTPKLKKKIGQGFVQLLSCSTVLHLRFCLRVCYRGSNYLLGQQHQHWWKGKKWWLNCGKPGGLCKTLFFDWSRKILDVPSWWQALLGENLQQRKENPSEGSVWESWMWSSR